MQKVILIMGPTASGKTELALDIAAKKSMSIISVDSALIYKDMNIGTAKPDEAILEKYPHALVNICTPEEEYSVQNFIADAKKHIELAFAKQKVPVLVGGTAFYFHALQHGLSKLPESTSESRKYFNDLLIAKGSVFLHNELRKIDNNASEKIHHNDSQRIARALEVYYLTGKTLTELQGNKQGGIKYPITKFVLMPPREVLHQRIEERFINMLAQGFIAEMQHLRNIYNLNAGLAAMRSVGYRQVWQYLEGHINKEQMQERAIIATRQLCKRQSTWFRGEKDAIFITNNTKKVLDYV